MPVAGLAHVTGRPKRCQHAAAQPLGIDVEHLAELLVGERSLAIPALDPRQVAATGAGTPAARREETTEAVLQHRKRELQLTREGLPTKLDRDAAPARLVGRLSAAAPQLG